ncbi:MAG: glycosyltransferase [Deltaproteobacteria bacterium]|nr:glycosyltransferase [Deltaproteobacteria bacterium]
MIERKILIFTTCYNEAANIGPLIDDIAFVAPGADILVIDDSSPDGTWQVVEKKKEQYPQLRAILRPGKLGIGSAHKYAIFYAMREGYDTLLTMDADFSHDPQDIPALLQMSGPDAFVIGSRYCRGGKSDYQGSRAYISRLGNWLARTLLRLEIKELTTYFRVFDVKSLYSLPWRKIKSDGYSYGMQLIYYLSRSGVALKEAPIHFKNRKAGKSKIPKMQVIYSLIDLFHLTVESFWKSVDSSPYVLVDNACAHCKVGILTLKSTGKQLEMPVYTCLHCGREQKL